MLTSQIPIPFLPGLRPPPTPHVCVGGCGGVYKHACVQGYMQVLAEEVDVECLP